NATGAELGRNLKIAAQFSANRTARAVGFPSLTGLDGRTSDTSGRCLVEKLRNFAGSRFAIAEISMFSTRVSASSPVHGGPFLERGVVYADGRRKGALTC
ncbi:MAG TPA: hypothetical protein VIX63_15125, partial [Vicinamibacterales bacterium]